MRQQKTGVATINRRLRKATAVTHSFGCVCLALLVVGRIVTDAGLRVLVAHRFTTFDPDQGAAPALHSRS